MKKVLSCLLAVMLFLTCIPTAMAVDNARDFFFELSVDGSDKKEVQPGDIIQVDFNLKRSDSGDAYTMYGMQNEIRYDSNFFELVEGSALLSNGISTTDIGLRDNYREFYMNFVSLSGGEEWNAQRLVGSFKLKVIATSGVSKITNQDYLVSTKDGTDEYKASTARSRLSQTAARRFPARPSGTARPWSGRTILPGRATIWWAGIRISTSRIRGILTPTPFRAM